MVNHLVYNQSPKSTQPSIPLGRQIKYWPVRLRLRRTAFTCVRWQVHAHMTGDGSQLLDRFPMNSYAHPLILLLYLIHERGHCASVSDSCSSDKCRAINWPYFFQHPCGVLSKYNIQETLKHGNIKHILMTCWWMVHSWLLQCKKTAHRTFTKSVRTAHSISNFSTVQN